jgi:hypothetical protein
MTKLLASALALTLSTTGAWAESHTGSDSENSMSEGGMDASTSMDDPANLIRTRDITGGNVYTMNEADDEGWSPDTMYDAVGADWNDIGDIEDIVLNRDGQMIGIVAEVGGFLDIADKHVMIPVADLNLTALDDGSYAFVTRHNEEQLESMEGVDEGFWE